MSTLAADRDYALRRLQEVREIEEESRRIRAEIEAALNSGDGVSGADALRWAEFCERRQAQMRHVHVELDLIAFRPPPLWIWLPVWVAPPPWSPWAALVYIVDAITGREGSPAARRHAGRR